MPLTNHCQPCTHWLESFPTVMLIFSRTSRFPDLFGKVFLININSPHLIFDFCGLFATERQAKYIINSHNITSKPL